MRRGYTPFDCCLSLRDFECSMPIVSDKTRRKGGGTWKKVANGHVYLTSAKFMDTNGSLCSLGRVERWVEQRVGRFTQQRLA